MANVGSVQKEYHVKGVDDDLIEALKSISDTYEREDREERLERIPLWLKLEKYFDGLQRRYWDSVARDWKRLPEDEAVETTRHYDKIINIYRAHAEAIIAALSIKVPSAIFYPEDADVQEDIDTAEACQKIKTLVERHNDAKLLAVKALTILFNTGTIAAYIYNRKSSKYGVYAKPKYGDKLVKIETILLNCAECGNNIDEIVLKGNEKRKDKEEEKKCEVCGFEGAPIEDSTEEEIPEITGFSKEPKNRTKIELFSPLFVHMPFYARDAELMPWLRLKFEQHYSLLRATYPKLAKKDLIPQGTNNTDAYDTRRVGFNKRNLVTTECLWLRPWAFEIYADGSETTEKIVRKLQKRFPDGCYLVILDGQIVEAHNEDMDEHWVISKNPMGTYIHGEPIGKPLAPIQDLKNEVTDLQIETFEHAIPETFADSEVLNFKKYQESKARPGMMYPVVKPKDGSPISGAFHAVKTATLSEETEVFSQKLDNAGQFVIGSFPSIYGGPATSGSKTAREYTESRAMALQRLTTIWNIYKYFHADVSAVAVQNFIKALKETSQDEKYVDRIKGTGGETRFINIWIKQVEITGNIGRVEADAEEDLPQSPAQLKDMLIQLMTLKSPQIDEAIFHPENAPLVVKSLGATDLFIPGSDERNKVYADIAKLLVGEEVEVKEWENQALEAEVMRSFLISPSGLSLRKINEEGYKAVEAKMLERLELLKTSPGTVNPEGEENVAS